MNKLVVDTELIEINNQSNVICTNKNKLKLVCNGNNKVVLDNKDGLDLEIVLLDNSALNISSFNNEKCVVRNITIIQNSNTKIFYKESFVSYENCNVVIKNVINGNNNQSNINLRVISKSNNVNIDVLADIKENTKNNELVEDIKGITDGGFITIKPNMEINTYEVVANHYVTISKVSDEEIFYLMSKGLSKELAKNLILNGFIKSIMMDMEVNYE